MSLGWAVVGAGVVADRFIAPAIAQQADSRVVATFDVDPGRARSFAERHGGATPYDDLARLLEDPAVDVVYVASPNAFHAPQAVAALRAGKHVLVEKPMALSLAEGREMVSAARRVGRLLGVGYQYRHKPSNLTARDLVAEGRIGRVFFAEIERGSSKTGFPWHTWRAQPELAGGGTIVNQAVHTIDLLRFLTGRSIVSVSAKVDKQPLEDVFAAVCTLEDGAIAMLASHQLFPNTRPEYVLCGERGWIRGVGAPHGQPNDALEVHDASGTTVIPGSERSPYWCEVKDFVRAVLGQAPLNGDGEDGLHVIAVVEAIFRAVREERAVAVEPIW